MIKDYMNMYVVFGSIALFFLFMIISTMLVGQYVSINRSCIATCDTKLMEADPDKGFAEQRAPQIKEAP